VSIRVAHLCKDFSKRSETFIYDYVTELERQGVDNHVVANERVNPDERPFDDVTVVPWTALWSPRRVGYRLLEVLGLDGTLESSWRELWPGAEEAIDRIAPDVLHAHFGRPGVKAVPIAEQLSRPLIVTFYGYDISKLPREKRWREAYESIWRAACAIVVLSEDMKEEAVRLGAPPDAVRVVHLARDLDDFPYRPPSGPVSEFISVGRLTGKKGHIDAIRAVQKRIEAGEDLHLRIVGDGPQRDELEQYIQAHDLQSSVELLGSIPNAEVARRLQKADAFLLCSKTAASGDREGTPTVLIEAQAVGLPCVSTTHAGIPEMLPESNHSLLAPEGEVDAIAERLRWLRACSDEELREVSAAGREIIETSFSLSSEAGALREIYERAASNQKRAPTS
jgi:glycosyltransferase involved in cell wall biosynthesis